MYGVVLCFIRLWTVVYVTIGWIAEGTIACQLLEVFDECRCNGFLNVYATVRHAVKKGPILASHRNGSVGGLTMSAHYSN
jgi:hypothetical protein